MGHEFPPSRPPGRLADDAMSPGGAPPEYLAPLSAWGPATILPERHSSEPNGSVISWKMRR
jgi:hypothetical protein